MARRFAEFWKRLAPERRFDVCFVAALAVCGAVYVGNTWSPSSYAIIRQALQAENTGLVWGTPRPQRGDEFGWSTPLLQSALRNGFHRYDTLPPYHEDLRTLYALPLLDAAIPLKPSTWAYFLLPPAYAFSLFHFAAIAAFLSGFTWLFSAFGLPRLDALLVALILFFSAYTQYWWNGFAVFFLPVFPWLLLIVLSRRGVAAKTLLLFWGASVLFLLYFYPPTAIPLAFAGAVLVAALRPEVLRPRLVAGSVVAGAAAAGVAAFYLRDALRVLAHTVYPGNRVTHGGGISWERVISQLFPTALAHDHVPLVPGNICELSMLGSLYVLAVLCFVDVRALRAHPERARVARELGVLGAGVLLTHAWLLLPLPSWAGMPLLWHRVQPGRMVVASGLLVVALAAVAANRLPLKLGAFRLAGFAAAVVGAYWYFKVHRAGLGLADEWRDVAILVPVAGLAVAARFRGLSSGAINRGLLASAAWIGVVSFCDYNPIQSARAIFEKPDTPVTRELDRQLREGGRGYIATPFGKTVFSGTGLPLIGLGYPSIAYATFAPKLDFWRALFPELPPAQFDEIFNNAGSLVVDDVDAPYRRRDAILTVVPIKRLPAALPGSPTTQASR